MLIAILVLLGLAGAIWYFANKQAQAIVTLTQEDVVVPTQEQKDEALKQAELDALAKAAAKPKVKPSPSVEQIESGLAETPVVKPTPNETEATVVKTTPNEKPITSKPATSMREFNALVDVVEEAPVATTSAEVDNSIIEAARTVAPAAETTKPAKKKRRYYPKKK